MHEYFVLKEAIESLGLKPADEELHPDVFGSALCVFGEGSKTRFRLIWDGKEGCGFLQTPDSIGGWNDVGPYVTEGANPGSPQFTAFISAAHVLAFGHEPA